MPGADISYAQERRPLSAGDLPTSWAWRSPCHDSSDPSSVSTAVTNASTKSDHSNPSSGGSIPRNRG